MKTDDVAIYSTYCGTLGNKTFNPHPVSDSFPHFFISNNHDVLEITRSFGWNPLYIDCEISENVIVSSAQAKYAKAAPHLIPPLTNFNYLFYKDDKLFIDTRKIPGCIDALNERNSSISMRPHPFLSGNILYEFAEAMLQSRYKAQWENVVNYMTQELNKGHTLECQLYWTSAILRNMSHPDTININNIWLEHIQRCGIECQISFDFIAQKFESIGLLPLDLG